MREVLIAFTFVPYAIFLLALFCFVLRLKTLWLAKAVLALWLFACCSIYVVYERSGFSPFYPEFPPGLIWIWDWAYLGAMLLCALSLLCWPSFRHKGKILVFAAWVIAAWGVWCGVKVPDVNVVEVSFADLPMELDGYRIVQLSDFHASQGVPAWRTRQIVERVNGLKPDLICLTGDFADGNPRLHFPDIEPIRDLRAKDGVYAVSGNHDWFGQAAGKWMPCLRSLGIPFLENTCVFPRKSLALGGVNDTRVLEPYSGVLFGRYPNVGAAFAAATNGEFRVLLEHRPERAPENVAKHGVRLQLSGHTHGGVLPILGEIVRHFNAGFLRGLYRLGDSVLYVNRGCGQCSGFLVRLFDPSEIAVLILRKGR